MNWHPNGIATGPEPAPQLCGTLVGCTKQIAYSHFGIHLRESAVLFGISAKKAYFEEKLEIHGAHGSVHAMNFGRNPNILGALGDVDAFGHCAQAPSIKTSPESGPEINLDQGESRNERKLYSAGSA
jgi:hypothetical protein